MTPEIRATRWHILPKGEPIYSEQAIIVEIDDESAGEFVKITQDYNEATGGEIRLDPGEWETVRQVVDMAVKECRATNK